MKKIMLKSLVRDEIKYILKEDLGDRYEIDFSSAGDGKYEDDEFKLQTEEWPEEVQAYDIDVVFVKVEEFKSRFVIIIL